MKIELEQNRQGILECLQYIRVFKRMNSGNSPKTEKSLESPKSQRMLNQLKTENE